MKSDEDIIEAKVMEIINRYGIVSTLDRELNLTRNLADWGINSFRAIYLLYDLEEVFKLQIPDNYLTPETFESPLTIMNCVRKIMKDAHVS